MQIIKQLILMILKPLSFLPAILMMCDVLIFRHRQELIQEI